MQPRPIHRRQVLQTLAAGGLASTLLLGLSSAPAAAAEKHPHIREAIKALKDARVELKERAKIFGGHGEKALKAVDEAIDQLEKALDFAAKN